MVLFITNIIIFVLDFSSGTSDVDLLSGDVQLSASGSAGFKGRAAH